MGIHCIRSAAVRAESGATGRVPTAPKLEPEENKGDGPLLRHSSRRGRATGTRQPQTRNAREPTPAASPRDLPHTQRRLGIPDQVEGGEPFTADQNQSMDMVTRIRGIPACAEPGVP